ADADPVRPLPADADARATHLDARATHLDARATHLDARAAHTHVNGHGHTGIADTNVNGRGHPCPYSRYRPGVLTLERRGGWRCVGHRDGRGGQRLVRRAWLRLRPDVHVQHAAGATRRAACRVERATVLHAAEHHR